MVDYKIENFIGVFKNAYPKEFCEEIINQYNSMVECGYGKTRIQSENSPKIHKDDVRDAPALDIAKALIKLGASVSVTDPIAVENCKKQNPDLEVNYIHDPYELAQGKDALILVTEWDEYRKLDLEKLFNSMNGPKILLDGRNVYSPVDAKKIGFNYISIGR